MLRLRLQYKVPSICIRNILKQNHSIPRIVRIRLFSDSTSALLPGLNPEQIRKIGEADLFYRTKHIQLENDLSSEERDIVRRRRMIYRSKQRGWLEADILLGSWARINVPTLNEEELDELEIVLKEETIDVYNYVSGKDPLPDHLKNLGVMKKLQEYAMNSRIQGPEEYEKIKKDTNLI